MNVVICKSICRVKLYFALEVRRIFLSTASIDILGIYIFFYERSILLIADRKDWYSCIGLCLLIVFSGCHVSGWFFHAACPLFLHLERVFIYIYMGVCTICILLALSSFLCSHASLIWEFKKFFFNVAHYLWTVDTLKVDTLIVYEWPFFLIFSYFHFQKKTYIKDFFNWANTAANIWLLAFLVCILHCWARFCVF